jgi:hypothetical protein
MKRSVTRRYGKLYLYNSTEIALAISCSEIQAAGTCIYSAALTGAVAAIARRATTELEMNVHPLVFSLLNHHPLTSSEINQSLKQSSKDCTKIHTFTLAYINIRKPPTCLELAAPAQQIQHFLQNRFKNRC